MATITQIRGALLEEAILFLLKRIGYEPYEAATLLPHHAGHIRSGHSGLEVRGRGTWHQLDAFALWKHSPAFLYPLHLMIEAKCYALDRPVGVEVPRNSIGVLKDISENYFTYSRAKGAVQGPRYNYSAAIFSTSGFTRGASEYAVAHQIFLIQYDNIPAIAPLIDSILSFDKSCLIQMGKLAVSGVRMYYRHILAQREPIEDELDVLTERGKGLLRGPISGACRAIEGSYFGMLQGQWPLHLLRLRGLPAEAFGEDIVQCRVLSSDGKNWKFVPRAHALGAAGWFELEFSLPSFIAELVLENWEDRHAIADLKQQHFSYVDLTGIIGGIRRSVRLQLDQDWIHNYVRRLSER
jgi:hypothetical protein